MTSWSPAGTWNRHRAAVGDLVAREHAVWRVTAVTDTTPTEAERDVWVDAGMPDVWRGRPYRVDLAWVAGVRPAGAGGGEFDAWVQVPAEAHPRHCWDVYPSSGRWPQCSCCGEPMPCRAEVEDREVTLALRQVEKLAKRRPGCCWGCGDPITSRQKSVTYPGDNLDLPGGMEVRFHTRSGCRHHACRYEVRWIAGDPRRERILTWPKCGGMLVVHGDGSSECQSGPGPLGSDHTGEPDCRGHLTHDHYAVQACYAAGAYLTPVADMPGCPRGCDRDTHPGTRTTPRPPRVAYASPALDLPTA
jgi:hypothetical protein